MKKLLTFFGIICAATSISAMEYQCCFLGCGVALNLEGSRIIVATDKQVFHERCFVACRRTKIMEVFWTILIAGKAKDQLSQEIAHVLKRAECNERVAKERELEAHIYNAVDGAYQALQRPHFSSDVTFLNRR